MPDGISRVVVTGAAGGIGQALVRAFTGAGCFVIATDRAPPPGGLDCGSYLKADLALTVADESYARSVFESLRGMLAGERLHALVNNAATQILGGADDLTRASWRTTLDVNLLAPFVWTQALLPQLEAGRGSVINISSVHARLTKKNFVAYATSKAGLSGLTRALAVDLAGRVRVNAIEPAAVETEMLVSGFSNQPEAYASLARSHPSGRLGRPQEVAALAVALAGGDLAFMNGACVALDGGIGSVLHDPASLG